MERPEQAEQSRTELPRQTHPANTPPASKLCQKVRNTWAANGPRSSCGTSGAQSLACNAPPNQSIPKQGGSKAARHPLCSALPNPRADGARGQHHKLSAKSLERESQFQHWKMAFLNSCQASLKEQTWRTLSAKGLSCNRCVPQHWCGEYRLVPWH